MAGLYIRELLLRADAERVLVVAPGSLVDQWRDELYEKFGLEFRVFSRDVANAIPNDNPFEDLPRVIVRLDQVSRNEDYRKQLCDAGWDLVIFDEAHKLSAHYFGSEVKRTKRFTIAEALGGATRHLLLMTATPHNGKEEDFQLFMSLLDGDRFYGKFRDGVHKVDTSDLMRRMVKEELVTFEGKPLFPERKAYTVNYKLSETEAKLYGLVTEYVKDQMNAADRLDGRRRGSVGFALTALQRRLASSPEAIFQSLKRRHSRLEKRLREEKIQLRAKGKLAELLWEAPPEDDDDLNAEEQENLEEQLVDQASAAQTIGELEGEILVLQALIQKAQDLVNSKQDRKWEELSKILQDDPHLKDNDGRLRKIIIFTEHRDTLNYLHDRIAGVLGTPEPIVTIDGGTKRDDRRKVQELFRSDPEVRVLIATDAAGEGVNLQVANLMVNYDLPWNPNRLEQRFGRIHRIGQIEVCHLWNLVAKETREGDVYARLLEKLATESSALGGRVFDILGEVFEGTSLKNLLMDAIRYGDHPDTRARLHQTIDSALDHEHLKSVLDRNALANETMSKERLFQVKEEMEKAEARRLQPYFVRSFFLHAFQQEGGSVYAREGGRFEITHVPEKLRERDRRITGRNPRLSQPVLRRYERVCFTKDAVRPPEQPGWKPALLLHPGHPLMLALSDVVLEENANLLRQGTVLVDHTDDELEPYLLLLLTHEVRSGDDTVLSKRLQFVRVNAQGDTSFAGWAPHLDLEPLALEDRPHVESILAEEWLTTDQERRAIELAASRLVPEHYDEVASRRIEHVEKTKAAVHARLTSEIGFWSDRFLKLKEDINAGKDVRLNLDRTKKTLNDLQSRLDRRKRELDGMKHIKNGTPVALGGALVVPARWLEVRRSGGAATAVNVAAEVEKKQRTELLAMEAVRRCEEARGWTVKDVSGDKCGWDLTSYPPAGARASPRHIEVKGRLNGASTLMVTRNEILYALNQAEKFVLAIVLVNEEDDGVDGPYFLKEPFDQEPGWGVAGITYNIAQLLERAEKLE